MSSVCTSGALFSLLWKDREDLQVVETLHKTGISSLQTLK